MTKVIHGRIHGRTIEVTEELGLAEARRSKFRSRFTRPPANGAKAFLRTASALADDPHWDARMEKIHRERKLERRPLPEEE